MASIAASLASVCLSLSIVSLLSNPRTHDVRTVAMLCRLASQPDSSRARASDREFENEPWRGKGDVDEVTGHRPTRASPVPPDPQSLHQRRLSSLLTLRQRGVSLGIITTTSDIGSTCPATFPTCMRRALGLKSAHTEYRKHWENSLHARVRSAHFTE